MFLEDINNILNAGDVANLYAVDELDKIYSTMKPIVQDEGQQPTKTNLFMAYTKRVRSNIHMVICMRYAAPSYWLYDFSHFMVWYHLVVFESFFEGRKSYFIKSGDNF